MNAPFMLEVCAFSQQAALTAQAAGAHRVELCDNPFDGGTTPSYGAILAAREKLTIALYPIIRTRGLNYWYSADEWYIIQKDIQLCKELGCDGISIGAQNRDGSLDADGMRRIVEWAYPMGVTCNRVIDRVPNPFQALEQLIQAGCERVLTSGQAASAPEGIATLRKLQQAANGDIIVMPGAGVRSGNIKALQEQTSCSEFHSSARKPMADTVAFSNPAILDNGTYFDADFDEIKEMLLNLGA